jgi:PmbA protein
MAIASSRRPKVQTDESTYLTSFVTAMLEEQHAKGSGYAAAPQLAKFTGEAGLEAARNARHAVGGQRLPTGVYPVILGPQPVSDLVVNLLLPSLTSESFYSCRSAFLGEMGRPIASEMLTLYDHGALRGAVGSKALTCEGLPTGRTDLIREGVLGSLLSSHYETQRLLRDPHGREKLGINPLEHPDTLTPRNGFRLSSRGVRQFDALPSVTATNVFIEGSVPHTTESLLQLVGNGVYVGRIWYTYPMNGLRAGDFTCTVVADSYLIRNGQLGPPLQGNTIRITGNIRALLHNILGLTKRTRPILVWGSEEVVYAPELAVRELQLTEIAHFMESV